jgi:hypothetical protein
MRRAAVYDPDRDVLTMVGPGDSVAGREVQSVDAAGMTLRDPAGVRTLLLTTPGRDR